MGGELLNLSFTKIQCAIWLRALLCHPEENIGTGSIGEQCKLIQMLLGRVAAGCVGLRNKRDNTGTFAWLIRLEKLKILFQMIVYVARSARV